MYIHVYWILDCDNSTKTEVKQQKQVFGIGISTGVSNVSPTPICQLEVEVNHFLCSHIFEKSLCYRIFMTYNFMCINTVNSIKCFSIEELIHGRHNLLDIVTQIMQTNLRLLLSNKLNWSVMIHLSCIKFNLV